MAMYRKNDYVFYGSGGLCLIDDITPDPFPGAREGVTYYVMHTLNEPQQTIWNPVDNTQVLMRPVLTVKEAERLLSDFPALPLLEGENAKALREQYTTALKSGDPREWGRILRTYRVRQVSAAAKLLRVTEAEQNFYTNARRALAGEIALVLALSSAEADARVEEALAGDPAICTDGMS